jgi:hypothetical protein
MQETAETGAISAYLVILLLQLMRSDTMQVSCPLTWSGYAIRTLPEPRGSAGEGQGIS